SAPQRKPIAVEVDDVDIRGAGGNALVQNLCSLVDQGIHQASDDLIIRDRTPRQLQRTRMLDDQLVYRTRWIGRPIAGSVVVPARATLLAESSSLTQQVAGRGVPEVRVFHQAALADRPPDVVAGKVTHAERAHGEPEGL